MGTQPMTSGGTPAIYEKLVAVLEQMTADWETDGADTISPDTRLIDDLGFESIDVVQLVVAIEEAFGSRGLPFERLLMRDGRYVDELTVGGIVSFLSEHLPVPEQAGR